MFTICLSFLIFASSTFTLIGNLIVSSLELALGADLYVTATDKKLNAMVKEQTITDFLTI